ncbi:MAG: VOC family protein [Haloplanus sp.]
MTDDPEVSADAPDSPIRTAGTDHVTLVGSNADDAVAFYRDCLGMPLVMRQPNLDRPEVEHLYFDTGDGRLLTVFVEASRETDGTPVPTDRGSVHHVAFRIAGDRLAEVRDALDAAGHRVSEYDRGAFHSLYTRDPNGLTVELIADKFVLPDDRRADVLARAHARRVEDGATHVRGEHLRAALDALGLPVEPVDLPEAPAGTGVEE